MVIGMLLPSLNVLVSKYLNLGLFIFSPDITIKYNNTCLLVLPSLSVKTNKEKTVKVSLGSSYPPLERQIEQEESLDFVPDFVALRYLVQKSSLTPDDVLILLVTLANLLRLCDIHGYREIFVGPFKFVRGKTQWVIVSY